MGGHGAWSDATNVCMVPPAGYKKNRAIDPSLKHLQRETWMQLRQMWKRRRTEDEMKAGELLV